MVTERVAVVAAGLPKQVKTPQVLPPLSSTSRVLKLGLTPKARRSRPRRAALTQTDVSVLMKWTIEPACSPCRAWPTSPPTVCTIGSTRSWSSPQTCNHGVTLDQVKQAARQAAVYGSAGYHDTPNQRLAVQYCTRMLGGRPGQIVVAHRNGEPVLLRQVATLTTGNPPLIGEGVVNDEAGLLVVVEKYPWANTLEVTRDVEQKVEA